MLIDTHSHLNFQAFDEDRDEIIKDCLDYPMALINVGSQYETSRRAVELSKNFNFYNAIGLHPVHVFDEEFNIDKYQKLINEKTVAIGEIGFDYYHVKEIKFPLARLLEKQRDVFERQIKLAKDNALALICHGRNSKDDFALKTVYFDILELLKQNNYTNGVIHCFSGTIHEARSIINAGMYLGFTGIITFPKSDELIYVIKETPLEKILIETDSPYLSPQRYRGERNNPLHVIEVAKKIAEIKNISLEDVIKQTWRNAKKLFKI